MSDLITLNDICLDFGIDVLLDHANLQVETGERVCLIGRNGAGKSSLLRIIEGTLVPDSGSVFYKSNLRLARLAQELPQDIPNTVFEFVAEGLADIGQLLARYHALTHQFSTQTNSSQQELDQLEQLQHQIDAQNGWQFEQNIKTILHRLGLDADQKISTLSGGWQRRAALARALVTSPELLLLDEPTNHLDIEAIQWLEDQLLNLSIGLIFITHDRALLQRLATRIIELDRGHLTAWPGDYANFLRRKEEMLNAEAKENKEFDKKLAQEEKWIRQGIKARRTRNEGRVRALEKLRAIRAQRREVQGTVTFNLSDTEKSGALVIEAKNITQQYNHQKVIENFSIRIMRGDRIGLIGPNGVGKSTLLNILLGNVAPQQGTVRHGTKLQIAYFDQLRAAIDLDKTLAENVTEGGGDMIEINGHKRHVISYLSDFLFTPQRAMIAARSCSGGEINRLLLARLFSQPANLLVLDEPTNDLDIETLELLEELLCEYNGTLLIVSHDRAFLDNVVTSTLAFEGNGKILEYIGGYQDWLRQRKKTSISTFKSPARESKQKSVQETRTKLSYKERKELDELPNKIAQLEAKQVELQRRISNKEFYQQESSEVITNTLSELAKLETELAVAYQRWEALEKKE